MPGFAHPHVVVQDDVFNRSRITTVVVCALTTNLQGANEPGNVLLDRAGAPAIFRWTTLVPKPRRR